MFTTKPTYEEQKGACLLKLSRIRTDNKNYVSQKYMNKWT